MRQISQQKKDDVKQLLVSGATYRNISKRTGVSLGTIRAIREDANVNIEPNGAGRKSIMSSNDIRVVIRKILTGEYKSAADASRQLKSMHPNKATPSAQTIRRAMANLNYKSMKKPKLLPLTKSQ
ncbi:hypothetical protein K492DRAFT_225828 [Lichtheimia hyalospora FSU 10163]|nr:hypothetical protein K492DRAFT_225828 [Lichtheimia hyalospora FSU 10163]